MLEILSPAGSGEGVIAAVNNGADAVYLGFGNFNARRNAKNFEDDEFARAVDYCRVRGVKVFVTINTLVTDREFKDALAQARFAAECGADALIVQDIGLIRAIRKALPDMPLHGSTQMSVHNLDGVRFCAAMGLSRVVLARELNRDEIKYICENSPIEIEIFAHGALCMCYSGQCYMSSVIGRRSGNRGLCAQPCRMKYTSVNHASEYPLSLKDNCLASYLNEIEEMGVACVKIEGRMKRPEYSAIVTRIYSNIIKEKIVPTADDIALLENAFSRQGFTDGYFTDRKGSEMFGVRLDEDKGEKAIFTTAKKHYLNNEYQRVPVNFIAQVKSGQPARLLAIDDRNNTAAVEGLAPEKAFRKELDAVTFQTQLYKTGGTPFICRNVKCQIEPGLALPVSAINEMRRSVLAALAEKRHNFTPGRMLDFTPVSRIENSSAPCALTVSVLKAEQLSAEMLSFHPAVIYVPLEEFKKSRAYFAPFIGNEETELCAVIPRIVHDNELAECDRLLDICRLYGVKSLLCGNIGHMTYAAKNDFSIRGDFGLNIFNSEALDVFASCGLLSATLSFELRTEQIRDISKGIPTEIIGYGRLPLMVTENCLIKNVVGTCACDSFGGITDRKGATFPVVREFGCRNVVLNSQKLFLSDKSAEISGLGLWAIRVAFTTENPRECLEIMKCYSEGGEFSPANTTHGLYFRGVE